MDFAVPADHRVKLKESEKRDKYQDFVRELKKLWNRKEVVIPYDIDGPGIVTKGLVQGLGDLEIRVRVETIQTTALLEIGQNTEKSPGDLWRLAVTQTLVKNIS